MAPAGPIKSLPARAVVPAKVRRPAGPVAGSFARRTSVMSRVPGEPKAPCTLVSGRKPCNMYASERQRPQCVLGIAESCQNCQAPQPSRTLLLPTVAHLPYR